MRRHAARIVQHRRRGFSLIEATIVSIFLAFLALLLSATWSAFIRPTSDIAGRGRIAQEVSLAVASLSRDLSGSHADNRTEGKQSCKLVGRMQPDNTQLRLCYDSPDSPNGVADWSSPDLIVSYYVDDQKLIRWNEDTGALYVVARDISSFAAEDQGDGSVKLTLNFQYRKLSQTYTMIARDP